MSNCIFCKLRASRIVASNAYALAARDSFPVAPGHTLVVPRRHIGSWFETNEDERIALFRLLDECRAALQLEHAPDAYNIGINDGPAAGQSIPHLHIHLIPRYRGDQDDPRGGVRWILPDKAKYWT
ncbi:HIT family protein [Ectothiorhodospiraceae bacterium 2226]|nr:HIT family protein [Ectothiorhodospiraceae bacterium 2226]